MRTPAAEPQDEERAVHEREQLVSEATTKGETSGISLFDELCDINTLFGYVGIALFFVSFFVGLFQPFLTSVDMTGAARSILFMCVVAGMVVVLITVAATQYFTNVFYKSYKKKSLAISMMVLELAYPISYIVMLLCPVQIPTPVLAVLAFLFGAGAAYFHLSWELFSWKLSLWSITRFLCVILIVSILVTLVLTLAVSESFRLASGCFAVFTSVLFFYTIGDGRRSDYVIERDDSVGHLFVFDKRVDVAYFAIQACGGAGVCLLALYHHEYFVYSAIAGVCLLLLFALIFAWRRQFSGQFLLKELRCYICAYTMLLVLLVVPSSLVNIAALCGIVAAWFAVWVFQGIFLERVLGYGPMSVYFISLADGVNNLGFLFGAVFAVVVGNVINTAEGVSMCLLVVCSALLVMASLCLPVEAAPVLKHPKETPVKPDEQPESLADNLAEYVTQRSDELVSTYKLSKREADVLPYLGRGCSAKHIAAQLDISEHTVRVHVCHIYEKMGVHSKQALMALFDEKSIVKPERTPASAGGEINLPLQVSAKR